MIYALDIHFKSSEVLTLHFTDKREWNFVRADLRQIASTGDVLNISAPGLDEVIIVGSNISHVLAYSKVAR